MFDYLGRNPEAQERLRKEVTHIDIVHATPGELDEGEYLQCIIKETNRLRSTAWAFSRTAIEDVVVGALF